MKYNKLVRDKIPHVISQKGETAIFRIASKEEYWQKLKDKLFEEFEEFKNSESPEEFADLLEVMDAIIDYKQFNKEEILNIKIKKAEERGRFVDRIILEES
jgi:predicted house-cleaning noncanonical NTP pyrophosphatase (MazG superfamily)